MPKVTSLGHIGLYVRDVERSVAFYRDILGLQISDRSPRGSVFMTAQDRLAEHHELLIAPGRQDGTTNTLQQISFRCASLADIKDFHRLFLERKVPIQRIVTHGNTVSIYFEDPDSNTVEVYWPTRIDVPQPFGKPVDLTKSDEEILAQVNQLIAEGQQQT
jgi:catechol-2,3-dioxygenase